MNGNNDHPQTNGHRGVAYLPRGFIAGSHTARTARRTPLYDATRESD